MPVRQGDGPTSARIMVVGEVWGENEERTGIPFSGASGQELNRMLHDAGIMRSEVYATNVINARPPANNLDIWIPIRKTAVTADMVRVRDKFVKPIVAEGVASLRREIELVKPKLIIALGGTALWALTGAQGITKWRGSLLRLDGAESSIRVVPTYHPALVLRQWEWRAVAVLDLKRARNEIMKPAQRPEWRFHVRPNLDRVLSVLGTLQNMVEREPTWIDLDLETRAGHIACCGLSWSLTESISIPLMCVEDRQGYWLAEEEAEIIHRLHQLTTHPNCWVRGQNILYDCQYTYRHWHFVPNVKQDTMIAHHTLWAGLPKRLDFQASMYCEHYVYWKDDGKTWTKEMSEDQLWSYNCVDCVRTREVGEVEETTIRSSGLVEVDEFQQRLFWPVLQAMVRGVRVDVGEKARMSKVLASELASRETWLQEILGHPLNVRSPKQMQALFYADLKLPIVWKRTKEGKSPTLDDGAMEILGRKEPLMKPIFRKIREMRSLGVFKSTFVEMRLDDDQRMRCSYNICGTETYRFSSSENAFGNGGNLQNIPKGGDEDDSDLQLPNIRSLFIPDDGHEWFDLDLSKADLRVVVWESDCREMKAMLAEGRDPYIETAREFYRDPTITKTRPDGSDHPKYKVFKAFSHGTHYLGTPQGLSQRIGLTVHEAERTQKWYFGKYPAIKQWQERFIEEIKRTRSVRNKFGYVRHYLGRVDDSTFREAIAWLPQSTVGCLINRIWVNIFDAGTDVEVLLQVHDSLDGQYPISKRESSLAAIHAAGRVVIPYDDPLIIPIGVKTSTSSWGHCA